MYVLNLEKNSGERKKLFAPSTFLPHTRFSSFEAAAAANAGSLRGLADEGGDEKTEILPANDSAHVFHSKLIPSLVNAFQTPLTPQGKKGKAPHSRSCPWSLISCPGPNQGGLVIGLTASRLLTPFI